MCWISKTLTINLDKAAIQLKISADHNPIEVGWQWNGKLRGRWRLNDVLLLQDDVVSKCKKKIWKIFLKKI